LISRVVYKGKPCQLDDYIVQNTHNTVLVSKRSAICAQHCAVKMKKIKDLLFSVVLRNIIFV